MENKSRLVDYPLFRLTVFLAAGIFFFDRFLPDLSVWPLLLVLSCLLSFLFPSVIFKLRRPLLNYGFGVLISLCFFLIGGVLVLFQRGKIEYSWDSDKSCYYGIVESTPVLKGKTLRSEVLIVGNVCKDGTVGKFIDRNILLYLMPDSSYCDMQCGDGIVFYSSISKPISDVEFMGFDYRRYLFTKGISGTAIAYAGNWTAVKIDDPASIRHKALRCRDKVADIYRSWGMDDDVQAVVSALTIGDKSELTDELKAVYSAAGTSHVLALSGLHVGILSGILYLLLYPLKRFRGGRLLHSLIVVGVLWAFAFISGLSPSVVRAVTMCSLYLVASVLVDNGFCGFFSLSLTSFLMLVYQPMYLFDISFQLSFVAVLSIIVFYPVFSGLVQCRNRFVTYLWNTLSVSMAAQLGTLPLILYYFGTFPTYFLLANLVVGPLAILILSSAMASLLLSGLPFVGDICIKTLESSTTLLNNIMQFVHDIEGAQVSSVNFNWMQSLFAFILLLSLFMYFRKHTSGSLISILLSLCFIGVVEMYKLRTQVPPALFLARSELYIRNGKDMKVITTETGLYNIKGIRVGVMKSAYWRDVRLKSVDKLATLDYVYICRGFSGSIEHLATLFDIKTVVIDSSVSERYRQFLKNECERLNISCHENSGQPSYRILL
ncbi:MAG: ComEC family competence protein [Candidatus Phocaeicola faecipullorum]|nr:ComEC family competence protein [Candidatus Phocaeicola faecipullorum]